MADGVKGQAGSDAQAAARAYLAAQIWRFEQAAQAMAALARLPAPEPEALARLAARVEGLQSRGVARRLKALAQQLHGGGGEGAAE